jgi:hypothetical protein
VKFLTSIASAEELLEYRIGVIARAVMVAVHMNHEEEVH